MAILLALGGPSVASGSVAHGDFDGDGYDDIAIGTPGEDVGSTVDAGVVNIRYGGPTGVPVRGAQQFSQNEAGGQTEPGDGFGAALASGDFDGDGFADLAIGVPLETPGDRVAAGAVNVMYGAASGLSASRAQQLTESLVSQVELPTDGDRFGTSLAVGRLNGDGFDDLAIGAPNASGTGSVLQSGVAYEVDGRSGGLLVSGRARAGRVTQRVATSSERAEDHFATTLATGDFDGDGLEDLAAAPRTKFQEFGDPFAGRVTIFRGAVGAVSSHGDGSRLPALSNANAVVNVINTSPAGVASDYFDIRAMAAADFDHDGRAELVVGMPRQYALTLNPPWSSILNEPGLVHILNHGLADTVQLSPALAGAPDNLSKGSGFFGWSLAVGDVNGDNHPDLAIGAPPTWPGGAQAAGVVYAVLGDGSATAVTSAGARMLSQYTGAGTPEKPDELGTALTSGDLDHDGYDDLIASAPGEALGTGAEPQVGVVNAIQGSASGLASAGAHQLSQSDVAGHTEAGDRFGGERDDPFTANYTP